MKGAAKSGWVVLAVGIALLVAGVTVSVVRHNRHTDAHDAKIEAQSSQFQKILRRTTTAPPRFQVSYVEIPLATAQRLIRRGPTTADTVVTRRIAKGRVDPDFGTLAGASADPISVALREQRANLSRRSVVALLVTQTTPGDVKRVRLDVDRLSLSRYADVWDPLDVLRPRDSSTSIFASSKLGARSRDSVQWTPRLGRATIVPLSILHLFLIPHTSENASLIEQIGGTPGFQIAAGDVLAPIRLVVERKNGRQTRVGLKRALHPVVLATAPARRD